MYEYNAKVLKIVDGDTLDVSVDLGFSMKFEMRIRMYGINAPETRTKDLAEKTCGLKTKNRLAELLENKDVVIKTIKDEKEKYGRYLATILLAGIDINEQLVSEGLAVKYMV